MKLASVPSAVLLLSLSPLLQAQQAPGDAAPKPLPVPAAPPADLDAALHRVIATPDASAMRYAVDAVVKAGADGRARVKDLLARVATAEAVLPPLDPAAKPDPKAATEPLGDDMQAVVKGLLDKDAATADAAATKLKEGAATAADQVRKIAARSRGIVASCIQRSFRDQTASNAIFAGQYTHLADLGPLALETITGWLSKPPPAVNRALCIRAIRDLVEKPDDHLMQTLKGIASSAATDPAIPREARFALAQFGDRSLLDPQIEKAQERAKGDNMAAKGTALAELADIYYNTRDYKAAVDAYKQYLTLIEEGKVDRKSVPSVATLYYNACCSMALAGMTDDAFAYLDKALEEGRKSGQPLPRRMLEVDMDIASLRSDPRYAKALAPVEAKKPPETNPETKK